MPGPPRTPTRILELRGSWRAAVRRKRGEPTPEPGEPPMPACVADDAEARDEWQRVASSSRPIRCCQWLDWLAKAVPIGTLRTSKKPTWVPPMRFVDERTTCGRVAPASSR